MGMTRVGAQAPPVSHSNPLRRHAITTPSSSISKWSKGVLGCGRRCCEAYCLFWLRIPSRVHNQCNSLFAWATLCTAPPPPREGEWGLPPSVEHKKSLLEDRPYRGGVGIKHGRYFSHLWALHGARVVPESLRTLNHSALSKKALPFASMIDRRVVCAVEPFSACVSTFDAIPTRHMVNFWPTCRVH